MKQSVTQILDFFKKHKYGRMSLVLLLIGLVAFGAALLRLKPQEKPIPLSQVAAAISAGDVVKVEDSQDSGITTIHYKDGKQRTTLRDQKAPFLEQMQLLGVSNNQLSNLHYEIVEKNALTGEKTMNLLVSVAMLGLLGFAMFRLTGGPMAGIRKKYTEGDIPNLTFQDVAGIDESREELVDIVTFLKNGS